MSGKITTSASPRRPMNAYGSEPIGETLLARRQALEAARSAESAQFDALEAQARLMLDAHLLWEADGHEANAH